MKIQGLQVNLRKVILCIIQISLSEDLPDLTYSPTDSVKFEEDEYG